MQLTKPTITQLKYEKLTVPFPQTVLQGNQSGAIKGGGTELPRCIALLFLRDAATRRVSARLLFGDRREAYYSVLLGLVLGE